MDSGACLNLQFPLLYVNPPINANPVLIEEVFKAGGLGIIDQVTSGPIVFNPLPTTPYGMRVLLNDLSGCATSSLVTATLISLEDAPKYRDLDSGFFHSMPIPVFAEVADASQAREAERAGAAGLIAKGNEGPGWVSDLSGFVLLQNLLLVSRIPVFLQGGVGLRTAAGAFAAGAAGVVLDVHLLLAEESAIGESIRNFLTSLRLPATVTLAETTSTPLRVYSRMATKIVRELKQLEDSVSPEGFPDYVDKLHTSLRNVSSSPD